MEGEKYMNTQLIKKIEQDTDRVEKQVKKVKAKAKKVAGSLKAKLIAILIAIILFVSFGIFVIYQINNWFEFNKFVFKYPVIVKLQQPISIVTRLISPISETKEIKESELMASGKVTERQKRDALVERVYQITRYLETKVGFDGTYTEAEATHLYCQSIGQINEMGYFPEGNRKFCFKDEPDQRNTFTIWTNKRLDKGMTMSQIVCLYVTGNVQPMCKRSQEIGL